MLADHRERVDPPFPVRGPRSSECPRNSNHDKTHGHVTQRGWVFRPTQNTLLAVSRPRYSYRNASAGSTLAAADDGYSVASSEIPIETTDTITPSSTRGAKGNVSME